MNTKHMSHTGASNDRPTNESVVDRYMKIGKNFARSANLSILKFSDHSPSFRSSGPTRVQGIEKSPLLYCIKSQKIVGFNELRLCDMQFRSTIAECILRSMKFSLILQICRLPNPAKNACNKKSFRQPSFSELEPKTIAGRFVS